jgi:lyso-ornithine lipid O-acyltransferase
MIDWHKPPSPSYGSNTLAALRCAGFLAMLGTATPVYILCKSLWPQKTLQLKMFFYRCLLKLIGFQVRTHGAMNNSAPVFYVANHISYLDIPVLGALLPASFVAKSEVASWPVFGFMARLFDTVFIERRQARAAKQRDTLGEHMAARHNLILFPEGTSTDGQRVLPFKSSLFGAIENAARDIDVSVQPVSVSCTAIDGLPVTQNLRHVYGWYGDLSLIPHLWLAFKCGRFTIDVIFHPPIHAKDMPNRKDLAAACQKAVAHGVEQCVTGRWLAAQTEPALIAAPV